MENLDSKKYVLFGNWLFCLPWWQEMFQDLLPGSEVTNSNPVVAAAAAAVAAAVSSASEITVPIVSHTTVS